MGKMKDLRTKKRLTIYELSKKAEVSISTLYNLESGRNKAPCDKTINRICKVLGCTKEDLLSDYEEKPIKYKKFKCYNKMCPLNKNDNCENPIFLSGQADCFGKDRVQCKNKNSYGNTKILFANKRIKGQK